MSATSPGHVRTRKLYPLKNKRCERCGAKAQLRHHKDENPENTRRSNIEFLCHKCHTKHHHTGSIRTEETKQRISEGRLNGKPSNNDSWLDTVKRDGRGRFTKMEILS